MQDLQSGKTMKSSIDVATYPTSGSFESIRVELTAVNLAGGMTTFVSNTLLDCEPPEQGKSVHVVDSRSGAIPGHSSTKHLTFSWSNWKVLYFAFR